MPEVLLATAIAYLQANRAVLPIAPGRKAPSLTTAGEPEEIAWKPYQRMLPRPWQVRAWFRGPRLMGIGIAAGPVSGATLDDGTRVALEFMDIDAPDVVPVYEGLVIVRGYGKLLASLPCEDTPKGGRHYGYLCRTWGGNTVFARRKIGRKPDGSDDVTTLIETRGEGGLCVVAPTPPGIHPEHPERGYVMVRGTWERIPIITPEARHALWECARALNEYVGPDHPEPQRRITREQAGDDPGDHYNGRVTQAEVLAILERHGWVRDHRLGEVDYLRRPGKNKGWSATLGHVAPKVLYVFSSNASPFEGPHKDHLGTPYDPFGVYTRLEHGGDFSAAAKVLAAHGYGNRQPSVNGDPQEAPEPPLSDPCEGRHTLPVRPYIGYTGYRPYRGYRGVTSHG
jgi:Bifunctional DNA primase/polymerase, N-terminal